MMNERRQSSSLTRRLSRTPSGIWSTKQKMHRFEQMRMSLIRLVAKFRPSGSSSRFDTVTVRAAPSAPRSTRRSVPPAVKYS